MPIANGASNHRYYLALLYVEAHPSQHPILQKSELIFSRIGFALSVRDN